MRTQNTRNKTEANKKQWFVEYLHNHITRVRVKTNMDSMFKQIKYATIIWVFDNLDSINMEKLH